MAKALPWEIIVDILIRLPVKDVLLYRCVSKQWRPLIDGPDFINLHLNHSKQSNSNLVSVLFGYKSYSLVDLEALSAAVELKHPIDGVGKIEFLGSCSGLLAFTNCSRVVFLWNPSTRRNRKLPISIIPESSCELVFENTALCGFGYDPINDDYKLMRTKLDLDSEINVYIYSAKANAWKTIERDFPYDLFSVTELCGVFIGSALHWVITSKANCFSYLILAFDLVTVEYHE